MKTSIKTIMVVVAACALSLPAFAYTISGTIPPGTKPVVINLHKPIKSATINFKFSAPKKNAGVAYALDFCVGPAENPCGSPSSHVVNVPEGQTKSASFDSVVFSTNILVVGQGTKVAVPFSVQVN